MTEVRVSRI